MWTKFKENRKGGATIEYAIFLCAASLLFVTAIALTGQYYKPQLTQWAQSRQVDNTFVGSIRSTEEQTETGKKYRVFQLPAGLKKQR
ncbi:MAG: hypothetical protein H2045_06690 [Rhizobiales bacterium]|nr:hypothetical protein [Hyphomicrobiales bacterium]